MAEKPQKACPFCEQEAIVTYDPIAGVPEPLSQVVCEKCGQYSILSRLIDEGILKEKKPGDLELHTINNHNKSAQSEGKLMIWIDAKSDRQHWEEVINEEMEEQAGYHAFEVREVESFLKE